MSTSTRVLLLENNPRHVEQVSGNLKDIAFITLAGTIVSLAEFEQQLAEINSVDVVLIGIELAASLPSLIARVPLPQWIVLTDAHHSPQMIAQAMCNGAKGEIAWDAPSATFATGITLIAQRCPFFSGTVARALKDIVTRHAIALSPTQQVVLAALAQQQSIDDIVSLVRQQAVTPQSISPRTIYAQLDSILRSIHLADVEGK